MSLGKQELEDQIAKLTKDITTLQNAITDFEKKKQEAIAQLNAFQGAVQQCQLFAFVNAIFYRVRMCEVISLYLYSVILLNGGIFLSSKYMLL